MLTVADMGGGGVKNSQKSADVLYGRSLHSFEVVLNKVDKCYYPWVYPWCGLPTNKFQRGCESNL